MAGFQSLVGQKAPEFILKSLNEKDKEVKLSQTIFKDKIIVLDFFATFSKTSKKQVALMEKLYQKYNKNQKDQNQQQLIVLGITSETNRTKIQKFVTDNKLTFPILIEGAKALKDYKVTQLPLIFFVKKDGTVFSAYVGPPAYDEVKMDAEIAKLLGAVPKK